MPIGESLRILLHFFISIFSIVEYVGKEFMMKEGVAELITDREEHNLTL